jgi:hypothetical protein
VSVCDGAFEKLGMSVTALERKEKEKKEGLALNT